MRVGKQPEPDHFAQILGDEAGRIPRVGGQQLDRAEGGAAYARPVLTVAACAAAQPAPRRKQSHTEEEKRQKHAEGQPGGKGSVLLHQNGEPHDERRQKHQAKPDASEHGQQHTGRAARRLEAGRFFSRLSGGRGGRRRDGLRIGVAIDARIGAGRFGFLHRKAAADGILDIPHGGLYGLF